MNWLEQAENKNDALKNLLSTLNGLLDNFYSAKKRVLQFEVPGYTIYPNGYPTKMGSSQSKPNDNSIWIDNILRHYPEEPSLGLGKVVDYVHRPGKQLVKENRIIISIEGNRATQDSVVTPNGLYSINFLKISHDTHIEDAGNPTHPHFYQKIIVNPDELKNIPESVWIELLGWVLNQVEQVPFNKLRSYVGASMIDVMAEKRAKEEQDTKKRNSGCYIATACYGSYETQEVLLFRKYRDEVLLKSLIGKWFVSIYYRFSPFFAEKLKNMPRANSMVKNYILNPIYNKLK